MKYACHYVFIIIIVVFIDCLVVGMILSQCEHSSSSEMSISESPNQSDMDFINDGPESGMEPSYEPDQGEGSIIYETGEEGDSIGGLQGDLHSTQIGAPPGHNLDLTPISTTKQTTTTLSTTKYPKWTGETPQFPSQEDAFQPQLLTRSKCQYSWAVKVNHCMYMQPIIISDQYDV